jgi:transcriptional regulator with XRE-family HTH domain
MVDLKLVIASNIIRLRTEAGMTQSELGARLNYSDKSISKWERAESLPDANVLKQMSEIFGVSMDYLFSTNDEWKPDPEPNANRESSGFNARAVEAIALCGIATLALLVFILFWIINDLFVWNVFVAALPVAIITHLVLNSIWYKGKGNLVIIGFFIFSILLLTYTSLLLCDINAWQIFLLMIPAVLILFYVSRIRKKRK